MKRQQPLFFLAILVILPFFAAGAAQAQGGPTLLKRTIYVTPQKFLRYWKNPKAAEPIYNTNSWYPKIKFDALGPIESGSKIYVEFDRANGAPWMKVNMDTPSLGDDIFESIKPESIDSGEEEKMASIETGSFNFRIKMKNALNGTDAVLFSGKFKVNQLTLDQNIPENKGKKEFMVDYDWHLPVGYVWYNPQLDENVPNLSAQVCLKGAIEAGKVEAFLFRDGKMVKKATTVGTPQVLTSGADEPHHRYTIVQANFAEVRGFNNDTASANDYSALYFLDKNKGNYEIRITRNNQLTRTIAFTVGGDGRITDNGIAKNAKLGGVRMIFPAKIAGATDGAFNAAAWQTDALFGNPFAGFTIP